jgi:hypothetical protein
MCFIMHYNISDKVNEEKKNKKKTERKRNHSPKLNKCMTWLKVNTYTTNTIGIFCSLNEQYEDNLMLSLNFM